MIFERPRDPLPFALALASAALFCAFFAFDDLPMVDLPQHAAQIATWVRLDQPGSGLAERFELNLRTPYLFAYPLARLLAPWLGAVAALKLVVWLAVTANMLATRALAVRLGHDPWLALFGLVTACGLCFYFGFVSFMAAVPFGVFAVALALDHSASPRLASGVWLALLASLTLVSHGVAFAMAGGTVALVLLRGGGTLPARLSPLVAPLLVGVFWAAPGPVSVRIGGDAWELTWRRWLDFPALLAGMGAADRFALGYGLVLLAVALVVTGVTPARLVERRLPLVILLLAFGLFPVMFRGIALLHTRLPCFVLPVLLLALAARRAPAPSFVRRGRIAIAGLTALFLGVFVVRLAVFNRESAAFHALTRELPAGLAMRPLIFERESSAFPGVPVYLHYSAYYYVEKGGRQGYSFAMYPLSVIRYRPHVKPGMPNALEWRPDRFDARSEVPRYDSFLVRSERDRGAEIFAGSPERVVLRRRSGPWWEYAKAGDGVVSGGAPTREPAARPDSGS